MAQTGQQHGPSFDPPFPPDLGAWQFLLVIPHLVGRRALPCVWSLRARLPVEGGVSAVWTTGWADVPRPERGL